MSRASTLHSITRKIMLVTGFGAIGFCLLLLVMMAIGQDFSVLSPEQALYSRFGLKAEEVVDLQGQGQREEDASFWIAFSTEKTVTHRMEAGWSDCADVRAVKAVFPEEVALPEGDIGCQIISHPGGMALGGMVLLSSGQHYWYREWVAGQ